MTAPPPIYDFSGKRVFVAGHRGMVGSALVRRLAAEEVEVVTAPRAVDLTNQDCVREWFAANRPDAVIVAAAKVGGILANDSEPVPFLYDNLMIAANVIDAAAQSGCEKLLMLGSSCAYPREADQPIGEDALLSGPLEPTNQWYAVAKIAGIKLAEAHAVQHGRDFLSAMPCNLYGPGDNFDPLTSHVLPALIRRAHEAKLEGADKLVVWGSGTPRREFLHVDDLADGCIHAMKHRKGPGLVNIGSGKDVTIAALARKVVDVVGFEGELVFDRARPDGTPRKLMDSAEMEALGWSPRISLEEGLRGAYHWYLEHRVRSGPGR